MGATRQEAKLDERFAGKIALLRLALSNTVRFRFCIKQFPNQPSGLSHRTESGAPDTGDGLKLILASARLNNQKPNAALICSKADLHSCGGGVDVIDQVS